jgi:hypothetical protein
MSRAFVREDRDDDVPRHHFGLPPAHDRSYDAAAALVLIEAARDGVLQEAEQATGYRWGDPYLRRHVQRHLDRELGLAEDERDSRFVQLARRWLRANDG